MTPCFPILVGITGKMKLADGVENIKARLTKIFDDLDRDFPETPKILLSGVAAGTDLVAAELALRRPTQNWLVLAVLPFHQDQFERNFQDQPDALATLKVVLKDKRTQMHILPLLRLQNGVEAKAENIDSAAADLSQSIKAQRAEFRRRHYEQVGIWIAQNANLLIAVMPAAEQPDRIGGTARIVRYRQSGAPWDTVSREIVEASSVCANPQVLRRNIGKYTWLVDITPEAQRRSSSTFEILSPKNVETYSPFRASLRVAHLAAAHARGSKSPEFSEWPTDVDPAAVLGETERWVARTANLASRRVRQTYYAVSILFVIAVAAFEYFAKFMPKSAYVLAGYVLVFSSILFLYLWARFDQRQTLAENARAVREAMRLQRIWWRAGRKERVDQNYLQDADAELDDVREAVSTLLTWSRLSTQGAEPKIDWKEVFDPDATPQRSAKDWINAQVYFFSERHAQRRTRGHVFDVLSWLLFLTSGTLSVGLLAALSSYHLHHFVVQGYSLIVDYSPVALAASFFVAFAILTGSTTLHIHHPINNLLASLLASGALASSFAAINVLVVRLAYDGASSAILLLACITVLCGLVSIGAGLKDNNTTNGVLLSLGLVFVILAALSLGAWLGYKSSYYASQTAKYSLIVAMILLPALAGAMRFASEKLAVEAEELSYRDALGWFSRARSLLAIRQDSKLVLDLGLLALQEQELWLRTHRQRPLTPVIGG